MLEALILTLREGVEAALVVGIIVAFLRKEGQDRFLPAVWGGLAAAVAASFGGAFLLYRVAVDQEAFEGVLYVASAVVVASFVVWMWRHARSIGGRMRGTLGRILEGRNAVWAAVGLFCFTFLMVVREGIETVLFLSAVSLTTSGLAAALGAAAGIAAAAVFGVLFVRGSVRIDLDRFFKITGIALMIFVVQLLFNGYHELSEAGWVPADETTMAVIGPLVRHEFFFFAAVLALPLLMLIVPGRGAAPAAATEGAGAEARLERAAVRRQRRARLAGGILGLVILALLTVGFTYSRPVETRSPATPVVPGADGAIRLGLDRFALGELNRFEVEVGGEPVRFIAIRLEEGGGPEAVVTALDACLICGDKGYVQDEAGIACLHCHSVIHPPSIGSEGGCNPIPLASRVEGGELVVPMSAFGGAAPAAGHHAHHGA
jgi:high-affinity iron transporter